MMCNALDPHIYNKYITFKISSGNICTYMYITILNILEKCTFAGNILPHLPIPTADPGWGYREAWTLWSTE